MHDLITALNHPVFSHPVFSWILAVGTAAGIPSLLAASLVGPPALRDITAQAGRAICLLLVFSNWLLGAILGVLLFGAVH
jgi:hypothetical protein